MKRILLAAAVLTLILASRSLAQTPGSAPSAPTPRQVEPSYAIIDLSIADLNKGVAELTDCADVAEFLAASAAKTDKQVKGPTGEIPSHMAPLAPMKHKIADAKRVACITQSVALGAKFDGTMEMLANFEPNSSKGLAPRRTKVQQLRVKANVQLTRLGAKLPKVGKRQPPANHEPSVLTEP